MQQGCGCECCMSAATATATEQGVTAMRTANSQQRATDMISITVSTAIVTIWVSFQHQSTLAQWWLCLVVVPVVVVSRGCHLRVLLATACR